ncbi:MAG: orotate phosphoribosyltransferase [Lacipirellulaceae bacterium]
MSDALKYNKQQLIELVRDRALQFGEFTLASGKKASYYLDCRKAVLTAEGSRLVGAGMLELMGDDLPPLVGGMAIGADPITAAILTLAGVKGTPLRGIMVRKESKQHGTGKFVEGPYESGEEVVIVEDVVTTGGSSLLAIERCEAVGLKVSRVLAIVDRMEGGREAFAAKGYELTTLLTIEDFGIAPPNAS